MQNSGVVGLKGTTSYFPCNMKWTRICATRPDVEVVLHDQIDDELVLLCPKMRRPLLEFRVACRKVAFYVPSYKCLVRYVIALVRSTTVYLLIDRTLYQANESAKYVVTGTIDVSRWTCSRSGQCLSSGRYEERMYNGLFWLLKRGNDCGRDRLVYCR